MTIQLECRNGLLYYPRDIWHGQRRGSPVIVFKGYKKTNAVGALWPPRGCRSLTLIDDAITQDVAAGVLGEDVQVLLPGGWPLNLFLIVLESLRCQAAA